MNPELTAAAEKAAYERGRRDERAAVVAWLMEDINSRDPSRKKYEEIMKTLAGGVRDGVHTYE